MIKQEARIENWVFSQGLLWGEVYGHPKFENGTSVYTSPVLRIDFEKGIAETWHTYYKLGKPQYDPTS